MHTPLVHQRQGVQVDLLCDAGLFQEVRLDGATFDELVRRIEKKTVQLTESAIIAMRDVSAAGEHTQNGYIWVCVTERSRCSEASLHYRRPRQSLWR